MKYLKELKDKANKKLNEEADLPTYKSDADVEIPDSLKEEDEDLESKVDAELEEEDEDKAEDEKEEISEEDESKEKDEMELEEEDEDKAEDEKEEISEEDDLPVHASDADTEIPDSLKEEDEKFEFDLDEDEDEEKEDEIFTEEDEKEIEKSVEALTTEEDESETENDEDKVELPESFKVKAKTIFEATVKALVNKKVASYKKQLAKKASKKLSEASKKITAKLVDDVDTYANYVAEEWMTQNKLAVETGIKADLTENFIQKLKKLFVESYVEIPENKVNIVEAQHNKIVELNKKLNNEMNKNVSLRNKLTEVERDVIISEATKDLTEQDSIRLTTLCESVNFNNVDEFIAKVKTLKKTVIGKKSVKRSDFSSQVLSESVIADKPVNVVSKDATGIDLSDVNSAISKMNK